MEVLDLVLTSFFSAPTVSKVQITDMLLLSTSFFSYPLPRSHRQGGFEKNMFPSTSYSFLFQIKAAAHVGAYIMFNNETYLGWKKENLHEEKQLPLIPSMVQFFDALRLGL